MNKTKAMEANDFCPYMKVVLNGDFGVVTEEFWLAPDTFTDDGRIYDYTPVKHYGVILGTRIKGRILRIGEGSGEPFSRWEGAKYRLTTNLSSSMMMGR